MGLLRTIFFIVLFYYIFKVLSRLFAPFLMKYAAKKAGEKFGGQFQKKEPEPIKKEGEISIDKMPPKTRVSNKDVGDYVDYEEID